MILSNGYARTDIYVENVDGSFTSPPGHYTQLTRSGGGFTERYADGTQFSYGAALANGVSPLVSIQDRNSNTITFQHDAEGNPELAIDTMGRAIDYIYENDRLTEVLDFAGRSIALNYDGNGDLFEITSPAVTDTSTGNDFLDGKTEEFTYSSGFADERLNHNLLTITAPNEYAVGGPPRVQFGYITSLASPHVDRVDTQIVGGANSSDVPSGGTISYSYEQLNNAPAPDDFITPVFQTNVTDANGNDSEYLFNQRNNIVLVREFTNRDIRVGDPASYETAYEWSGDYQLLEKTNPEGNIEIFDYDNENSSRFAQGNLLRIEQVADARGGDQDDIVTTMTYEPIYQRLRTLVDPRGTDTEYIPQNGGVTSPQRYRTLVTFDYQEGSDTASLAGELGITEIEVQTLLSDAGINLGLGDINGDGITDQTNGNVLRTLHPTVQLLAGSNQAIVEGDTNQERVELNVYNAFGQLTSQTDPEKNVDHFIYNTEEDPDGDGVSTAPPADGRTLNDQTGGYLRQDSSRRRK